MSQLCGHGLLPKHNCYICGLEAENKRLNNELSAKNRELEDTLILLTKERAERQNSIEHTNWMLDRTNEARADAEKALTKEREDNHKMRNGIRWYANPVNWEYIKDESAPVLEDRGEFARNIILHISGGNDTQ